MLKVILVIMVIIMVIMLFLAETIFDNSQVEFLKTCSVSVSKLTITSQKEDSSGKQGIFYHQWNYGKG